MLFYIWELCRFKQSTNNFKQHSMKTALLITLTVFFAIEDLSAYEQPQGGRGKIVFMSNQGQIADLNGRPRPDILFATHSKGANVFVSAVALHYQFERSINMQKNVFTGIALRGDSTELYSFSVSLEGANPYPDIIREERSNYVENFYLAHCPQGITNVPGYGRLRFRNVYPGIDWLIYSAGEGLKYDFILQPGADPSLIKLRIRDDDDHSVTGDGALLIKTSLGELKEAAPVSFCAGKTVATSFQKDATGLISFQLPDYDNTKSLTIDPSVNWSTYYGDASSDATSNSVIDKAGNVYAAGSTSSSSGIATVGGFQTTRGGTDDAFIVKMNSAGVRQWATYFGGNNSEGGYCAIDTGGNIFLCGYTTSTSGLATAGSHQSAFSGSVDGYLAKFNRNGMRLWATYLGGAAADWPTSVAVNTLGGVYICGYSGSSTGITTPGAYQPVNSVAPASEPFLMKFNKEGDYLWGTYYGAGGGAATQCVADKVGSIYFAGYTTATTGIAIGSAFQTVLSGSNDAFLAKFTSTGQPVWGTYNGGSGSDYGYACALDGTGLLCLAGSTQTTSGMASSGAYQPNFGGGTVDGLIAMFDTAGTRQWATYYGGSGDESFSGCAFSSGKLYVTGITSSTAQIAVPTAFQPFYSAAQDGFIVELSTTGVRQWASYFGGTGQEYQLACTADSNAIYLTGLTQSAAGIATPGAYQTVCGGGSDGIIVRLIHNDIIFSPLAKSTYCPGDTILLPLSASGTISSGNVFTAELSDGSGSFISPTSIGTLSSSAASATLTAVLPQNTPAGGAYRIRINSSNPAALGSNNGANLTVLPAPAPPVITFTGGNLVSNLSNVMWCDAAGIISGATGATYKPKSPGKYYALITGSNGCTAPSNTIALTPTMLGIEAVGIGQLRIYPNPVSSGVVNVSIDLAGASREISLTLNNVFGQEVLHATYQTVGNGLQTQLKVSDLTRGIYFMELVAEGSRTVKRLVIK